jgi:bifunctional non-homologous end joining protein LigD
MSLRSRIPAGFIEPCLPSARSVPPPGDRWLHEIKHDGYRMLARREGPRVRLFTRNGHDWTERFPLIREGMAALKVRSCLIDGEAVCCEEDGVPSFQALRRRRHDDAVFLYAFDLLELNGVDLRPLPLEARRVGLARLLRQVKHGLHLSDHVEADGPAVFRHACLLGVEGVVSKRKGSPYRSGRTLDWIKCKNPDSPAVKREAEEDWGRDRRG